MAKIISGTTRAPLAPICHQPLDPQPGSWPFLPLGPVRSELASFFTLQVSSCSPADPFLEVSPCAQEEHCPTESMPLGNFKIPHEILHLAQSAHQAPSPGSGGIWQRTDHSWQCQLSSFPTPVNNLDPVLPKQRGELRGGLPTLVALVVSTMGLSWNGAQVRGNV